MKNCSACGNIIEESSTVCDRCGFLDVKRDRSSLIECENHFGEWAVAVCSVCGKPVCGDCALRRNGRFFCDNTDHIAMGSDWAVIHGCASEFEADIFVTNLRAAEIEARFFSWRDHVSLAWVPIDLPIRVMVKTSDRDAASRRLIHLGLLDEVIPQPNS